MVIKSKKSATVPATLEGQGYDALRQGADCATIGAKCLPLMFTGALAVFGDRFDIPVFNGKGEAQETLKGQQPFKAMALKTHKGLASTAIVNMMLTRFCGLDNMVSVKQRKVVNVQLNTIAPAAYVVAQVKGIECRIDNEGCNIVAFPADGKGTPKSGPRADVLDILNRSGASITAKLHALRKYGQANLGLPVDTKGTKARAVKASETAAKVTAASAFVVTRELLKKATGKNGIADWTDAEWTTLEEIEALAKAVLADSRKP